MLKTIEIIVSGKVQGVFFRKSAREVAKELEITGEIRNLSNGDVKLLATGKDEALQKLVEWCHEGPPHALVEHVEHREISFQTFTDFSIRHF